MITIEPCSCGHKSCRYYWLVGIGSFVQGSGFTQEQAQNIADLLNRQASDKHIREVME